MSERIYDVIYCSMHDQDAVKLIEQYPNARVTDASDFIHEDRFSIEIEDETRSYFKNIIKNGLSTVSLDFQVSLMNKDGQQIIKQVLDELKTENPELFNA